MFKNGRVFKAGDLVKIVSKSRGKDLFDVEKYDVTKPQEIKYSLRSTRPDETIYVIKGDYYLERDLRPYFPFTDKLDDKLFEI